MADIAWNSFIHGEDENASQIDGLEDAVDILQDKATSYLSSLCTTGYLTGKQSDTVSKLIRAASDFERIGDQFVSISNFAKLKKEKGYTFRSWMTHSMKSRRCCITRLKHWTTGIRISRHPSFISRKISKDWNVA